VDAPDANRYLDAERIAELALAGESYGAVRARANTSLMQYIETQDAVPVLLAELAAENLIAADTEAAGYHRYHDRVCVLQLSTRTQTWVVDALAVRLGELQPLFSDVGREVVLHDADYDLRLLARDHGIGLARLFDTKLAAQFLGEPAIGLAGLVEKYLGVRLDKKHQRADWAQRPLPRELIEYAADDTRHLPALRDQLRAELIRLQRLHWAEEEFALRAAAPGWNENIDGEPYLRLKNIRDFSPRQMAALREMYAWRDRTASDRDVAPFRVLSNEAMVAVARLMPDNAAAMPGVEGVDAAALRNARELLAAVKRARELPEDALPARRRGPRRPAPDPAFDGLVERLKTVRDEAADQLGLDRGFLMPRQQLEDIVKARPLTLEELRHVSDVRHWQAEALGKPLLEALRK
jgi:ribonuclease D